MDAKQNLYEIQIECFEIFKAQNPEDFDVAFEIDGKKLYADKSILTKISPTFKSMLSDRWMSKDETIKIETYKFEDFKEFITFIYSGECSLNDKNIFDMIDIAEFFGVKVFKKACDKYLSNIQYNSENVFKFLELSDKYSLTEMEKSINDYISTNFGKILKSRSFQELSKSVMKNIVASNQNTLRLENFFRAVYQWAEFRAFRKQILDDNLNGLEIIKEDLAEMLQFFKFDEMNSEFIIRFVVKKSFLFSGDELSDILWSARDKVYVKIFDQKGKMLKGVLNCVEKDKIGDTIASQKNKNCLDGVWPTKQRIPTVPSKLIKRHGIEWYLLYDSCGDLAVKRQSEVRYSDYLLAELIEEKGFVRDNFSKIYIYR
uniref:BTB domain-containing protein n=1 Tax=Panagrolaimus davidi TaxID=227884 RepID=A0A914QN17_9BILA